ncbi:molybdopterin synthase sulfur carrier subunit-like, partial [Carlito syrichta]|uniref:Molybdopterin synthase sulfur carrier subunit n=1 Tax=Carlito syrichta TaxID=1868482 RepID=A0A1U7SPD2_CARSF
TVSSKSKDTYLIPTQLHQRSKARKFLMGDSRREVPRCQVEVLYLAKSAEIAGVHSETISVPQEIKALQLWKEIESRHPGLADVKNQVIFAVRQEYVELGDQLLLLQPGDEIAGLEIAIVPPISGG